MAKSLLVLGYVWPEPDSSAAGSQMMSLLHTFLNDGWQITFASPAAIGEHKADLKSLGITEQTIALNCSSFDDFAAELSPDVVIFDRFMLEEQFGWRVAKACPQAVRILDTEDLHSLRHARHQALKQGIEFHPEQMQSDTGLREIAAIFRSDLSLILSSYECELLQHQFQVPVSQMLHTPFMLNKPDSDDWLDFSARRNFISIGNFRHAPNWDSVLWLKHEIWPLIRQQLPQAELHIYGAYPPKKATNLHNPKQGFLVKGWANSARQVMTQARVCLAPLRFGAGIKGKLALAMQSGTPSVTTAIGIEGITHRECWPGAVAETPQQLANKAVCLYRDGKLWHHAQQQGEAVVTQQFNGEKISANILSRVKQLMADIEGHRKCNFIGNMLRHHSMRSTQYMSQWIEAKNQRT